MNENQENANELEVGVGADEVDSGAVEPAKKRKRLSKKMGIVVGVLGVLVVLGIGFMVWHNQPSFCNAICHTPMTDSYLETLEAVPGQPATDKWGNQVANARGMLASVHGHAKVSSLGCLDCHVPVIGQQVGEAVSWVTGNYEVVETGAGDVPLERTVTQLAAATGDSGEVFCLNTACHNITMDELVTSTSYMTRNVHSMHHENLDCGTCHKSHRASVNYCSKCHADATIPEGWITVDEAKQLQYYAA